MLCTHRVALCCAALHEPQKNGSKTRYSGNKTELRKEHRCFSKKGRSDRRHARVQSRTPRPTGTLAGDSFRPESDACDARELWCFALVSSSSASIRASHASRPTCLRPERSYGASLARSIFGSVCCLCALMTWFAGGLNYAQWSYPRAQRCTQGTNKALKPLKTLPQQNPAPLAIPDHEHAKPRS